MSVEVAISILMVGSAFTFGYIATSIDRRHSIMGWFFLLLAFIPFITAPFLIAETTATVSIQNILYWFSYLMIVAFMFSTLYLILFIITKGFEKLIGFSRRKGKDKYDDKLR